MYYIAFWVCLIIGVIKGLQELYKPSYPAPPSRDLLDFLLIRR